MISGRDYIDRPSRRFYEFGPFRIDADERILSRDGEAVPITPKVFDLLLLLVENNRHTLPKAELLERLWEGSFVEENSLSRNISILRKTLSTGADENAYIKTVPKLGYRFDADVRAVVEDEEELVVERRTQYSVQLDTEKHKGDDARQTTWSPSRIAIAFALATTIVIGIMLVVSRSDSARSATIDASAVDPEANDLYRRGREFWQTRSASGLHQAILLLEQAVNRDPNFALAHAALADAYAFDTRHWPKAEATARRALELDPDLGQPHASIGFVRLFWEWKTRDAEAEFRQAITASPDYATAHQWYAIKLAIVGHFNEAHAEMTRALELEPNSPPINADMCHMLYIMQRYDEAEAQCKRTLRLDPMSFNAHSHLYSIYTAMGKYEEAVTAFLARERLAVNQSVLSEAAESLRTAFETRGIGGFWRKRIEFLRMPGGSAYELARYHALLGENDAAILELERACRNHEFGFVFFFAEPAFRKLVDEPRYEELAARLVSDELPAACGKVDQ